MLKFYKYIYKYLRTFIVILLWISGWDCPSGFSTSRLFLLCLRFLCFIPVIGSGVYLLCFSLKNIIFYIYIKIYFTFFIFYLLLIYVLLFLALLCETDSVPSAEATIYSGEPSLVIVILLIGCWLYTVSFDWIGVEDKGCGPTGFIVT